VTAGGGVDTTARAVAQHLNSVFKQPFVVDNRTGAGGSIGIELVAKANADGYTFLICSSGIVTNAAYKKQNYDPVRDFQPVSNLTSTPYLVAVTPSCIGSITHLGAALLPLLSETNMLSVPFKGVADAYPAVANGDVNWIIGAAISALPLVKAGRMRAIAITTPQRSRLLPDLPTVAETVPGYEVVGWFGMFAPAGTPMALIERVSAETKRGLQRPEFARMVEAQGAEIIGSTPAELASVVKNEVQIWQKVVKALNVKP
jgi:tripartite-type tricarboxylate transporter receptor subunit TctC